MLPNGDLTEVGEKVGETFINAQGRGARVLIPHRIRVFPCLADRNKGSTFVVLFIATLTYKSLM